MTAMPDLFADPPKPPVRNAQNGARPIAKSGARSEARSDSGPVRNPAGKPARKQAYTARDIEVLEGLEPVRKRPGMYIGGTDERALHHLAAEVIDNAMDEAVAGHATRVEVALGADNYVTIRDNGRGIPTDPHPKFRDKSALEVILTTLHSGGKFGGEAYTTSGGLHGVGLSVVNALSDRLEVEVARDGRLWTQRYSRGAPRGRLDEAGPCHNRRGTTVRFHPDPKIFGDGVAFRAATLYRMARSKAYLIGGVEIRWSCAPEALPAEGGLPEKETIRFPGGIRDYLKEALGARAGFTGSAFAGAAPLNGEGRVEWAVAWPADEKGFVHSYVNTVPTPQGGSHEQGFRAALVKGLRSHAELANIRKAGQIAGEDAMDGASAMLSVFIADPQFQGQTKERLGMPEAARLVEQAVRDHFDHFLSGDPSGARRLIDHLVEKAEDRARRKAERDRKRANAAARLRLPGKLADCSTRSADNTEIFLVEGDSAGGSAKQARNRATQAVLPLRGKILNVASASADKMRANQELNDLILALGCGTRGTYDADKLRYERVIIMTDADVDGAHIASLLLTFFYREMPELVRSGHLYLAMPPLYRLAQGGTVAFARDDTHKDALLKDTFDGRARVEISRFKGLGEMPPAQLKQTTMDPGSRTLLRVTVPAESDPHEAGAARETGELVEKLMGRKPEPRFEFIQERAKFVEDIDL